MLEHHPYGEFIPKRPMGIIIGSFPIGKFSHPARRHEIKPHEFDFFFGGEKNLLWKLLAHAFEREIHSKEDILSMLEKAGLGVGDVIRSCRRKEGGASDSDLIDIRWNTELIHVIRKHKFKTIYFTSKKVKSWFNRLFPDSEDIEKITLISPSGQSLRGLARNPDFLKWRKKHPDESGLTFIYSEYKKIFSR